MEKNNLNIKLNPLYNKLNMNRPFKDIKFSNNQNNIFINKDKNFHNKYLNKIKERNKFKNRTLFDKATFANKLENDCLKRDKKLYNIKGDINETKENQIKLNQNKYNFNRAKKIRCFSQEQKNFQNYSSPKINVINKEEEEDDDANPKDINLFFENINKEFNDIGKLIKMTFVVDEKRKYDFNKNEFIILKIIENELKEKHGLNIKEFKYKNQKLNLYKSLKDNKLEDNCIINVIIE